MGHPAFAVVGPPALVYRVSRQSSGPFDAPPWVIALPDGTFGNRFDDPGPNSGDRADARFRIVYCASQRHAAFGESIARFRPSLALLSQLSGNTRGYSTVAAGLGLAIDGDSIRGVVPADWWQRRQIAAARLDPSMRFVDLTSGATLGILRDELSHVATTLGITDIDLSAVTGSQRRFTRACARHIYEQHDDSARPLFAGVRYLSRLHAGWECWAVFDSRLILESVAVELMTGNDPGLSEAAELLGLVIEQ